jgi:hypothetical protein
LTDADFSTRHDARTYSTASAEKFMTNASLKRALGFGMAVDTRRFLSGGAGWLPTKNLPPLD